MDAVDGAQASCPSSASADASCFFFQAGAPSCRRKEGCVRSEAKQRRKDEQEGGAKEGCREAKQGVIGVDFCRYLLFNKSKYLCSSASDRLREGGEAFNQVP